MSQSINRVVLSGNLTRDPELRNLPSGTAVCDLRVACNGRRRTSEGQWEDDPNYFNVTVWGPQGENCARYLSKGRGVVIDGRLRWREWESDGQKRQAVDIVAETVQFIGGNGNGNGGSGASSASSDIPGDTSDFVPAGVPSDDDIPF